MHHGSDWWQRGRRVLSALHYSYIEIVDQMVMDTVCFLLVFFFCGLFFFWLFNNVYLCYNLMICVLLNFTKYIHASLGRSRCKS